MKTIHYSIAPAIFEKVPGYIRGLVVVHGANNTAPNSNTQTALRDAEKRLASEHTVESLLADSRIASWREAFKMFGMNPSEFRPAHEALGCRAVQAKPLPFINTLVDIGNTMSLEKLMPIGVHPIENVIGQLTLRRATGIERFTPFGSDKRESPKPGEVIFTDEMQVHARAWVWRQAQCSVTLPTTGSVVVHVDALPPMDLRMVEAVCEEVARRIAKACGGDAATYTITAANREAVF